MTQKLKKMFRNEKGFTLVELLAVIVILGIIVAIAVPAIGGIIDKAETDSDEAEDELVLDAARLAEVNGEFTGTSMTEWDLVSKGYLEQRSGDEDQLSESNTGDTIYKHSDGTFSFEESTGSGTPES
ncbi:type II secretion system protein [Gracilibacillus oryzae]|uniref:Type II secretion system protein n=1 Tax=Gracilibacillus oryzae TaxID=1672701 RepID=A0A7C8GTT5_9BACI|nr:type II secretion system protein [Gracilibacillus oryzae]KAB8137496.1 type II secretion system protein [Gracilibacillus oryzae]